MSNAAGLPLTVSRFATAFPIGPAFGTMERTTWGALAALFRSRRLGGKDGANFVPATFRLEPDGRVRRLKDNLCTRTAVALDCETSKSTGEIPRSFAEAVARIKGAGLGAVVYTSHNHTAEAPRYRIVLPLSAEIAVNLPAVEVIADRLNMLGVLDTSKVGASSLFYLPSAEPGHLTHHETVVIDGDPIDAAWMREHAGAILAAREAEQARLRAEALEAATRRREERIKQGFDPDASIIESVRKRLDLAGELIGHGYKPAGDGRYLYPGSQTGIPGVYILTGRDVVDRVYSHHAADPLAAGNLPSWCRAKAIDVVDVVTILDFAGDQTAALRSLAERFEIETSQPANDAQPRKPDPRRSEIAREAFRLLRRGIPSDAVLTTLHRLNEQRSDPLPRHTIGATALWAARRMKEQADAR